MQEIKLSFNIIFMIMLNIEKKSCQNEIFENKAACRSNNNKISANYRYLSKAACI
jgi:hypothetical protein